MVCIPFVRHPGDQWCSSYYWSTKRGLWGPEKGRQYHHAACDLDEFLLWGFGRDNAVAGRKPWIDPPAYWRSLSFIDEYSDESFAWMLERHFVHRFVPRELAGGGSGPCLPTR